MEVRLTLTERENQSDHLSLLVVFGMVYVIFLCRSYKRGTTGSIKPQSSSFSNTDGYHNSDPAASTTPDTRDWPQWSEAQVVEWLLTCSDSSQLRLELAAVLSGQGLRGCHLPHITTPMLQTMGLSLGGALQVQEHISSLVETSSLTTATVSRSWLDQHDAEYNGPTSAAPHRPATNFGVAMGSADKNVDSNNETPNQEEAARTLMRQRFGLELPEIAKQDAAPSPPISPSPSPAAATTNPPLTQLQDLSSLPPGFLENMPANLAEIARRKPDLVRKILESRRHRQE